MFYSRSSKTTKYALMKDRRLFTNCWGGNFTIMKGSKALIATEDQQLDLNKEKKIVGGTQNDSDGNWN